MSKKFIVKGCRWCCFEYDGKYFLPCPYCRKEEYSPDVCTHPDVRVPRFGIDYDYMMPRDILCSSGIPDWCPLEDDE